jgi:hypothetical protein
MNLYQVTGLTRTAITVRLTLFVMLLVFWYLIVG